MIFSYLSERNIRTDRIAVFFREKTKDISQPFLLKFIVEGGVTKTVL